MDDPLLFEGRAMFSGLFFTPIVRGRCCLFRIGGVGVVGVVAVMMTTDTNDFSDVGMQVRVIRIRCRHQYNS